MGLTSTTGGTSNTVTVRKTAARGVGATDREHVVEEVGEGGHDGADVDGGVEEVEGVVVARHRLVVAVHQVHHVVDDGHPRPAGRLAHHPEVQECQPPVRRRQQVARVGVGVEEAVLQQLAEGALDAHVHELEDVQALVSDGLLLGQLDALHPLHGQHPRAGRPPEDPRHEDLRAVPVEVVEALAVEALLDVVELLEHALRKVVHQVGQRRVQRRQVLVHQHHCVPHQEEVELDALDDVRPLNLHCHLSAVHEPRLVHLPQAGCGDGRGGDGGVDLFQRAPHVLLDGPERLLVREAGKSVL